MTALRRPARLPVLPAPTAQEAAYRAALAGLLRELEQLARDLLADLTPALRKEARADSRADSLDEDMLALLQRYRGHARQRVDALLRRLRDLLARRAAGVDLVARAALRRQVEAVVRVNPKLPEDAAATLLARAGEPAVRPQSVWVRENVALVRRLGRQATADVESLVKDAARKGTRVEDLSQQLRERLDISRRRADLIARDQTTKLSAQFNEGQQRGLGVKRYTWRHSGVTVGARPEHVARDGKVFAWDDPPDDGHPGAAPNCRCTAEPIIDEIPRRI